MTPTNAVKKAAVAAFQLAVGLPADGIAGPATIAAMAKAGMTLADVYAGKQPTAPIAAKPSLFSQIARGTAVKVGVTLGAIVILGVILTTRKKGRR
jgi:peptidoglycan hydrolase-like protein with peptidoglycan-binding domain